jgi:hypothetical protein
MCAGTTGVSDISAFLNGCGYSVSGVNLDLTPHLVANADVFSVAFIQVDCVYFQVGLQ